MKFILSALLFLFSLSSFANEIIVTPIAGDNYLYLSHRIKYAIDHKIATIRFKAGTYTYSKPLFISDSGRFVSLNLIGDEAAHFNLEQAMPKLIYTGDTGYAIGYHKGRSSKIKGLVIYGNFSNGSTSSWASPDRYHPLTGINIDPYAYYWGDTTRGGSSGILIEECQINGFTVGVGLSMNGSTLNAENIHCTNLQIRNCYSAYVTCQRQSKQNTVKNLICWENVSVVFNGKDFGAQLGNIPHIDGVNIASGSVYWVFYFPSQQFSTSASHIFAELIESVGQIDAGSIGTVIRDSYFDFAPWYHPSFHFKGNTVTFDNVAMRYYDDFNDKRMIIDGNYNFFVNGHFDLMPIQKYSAYNSGASNIYFNIKSIAGSMMAPQTSITFEFYEWLGAKYIDTANHRLIASGHHAIVGDYIDGGSATPFKVYGRIYAISGDTLKLDMLTTDVGAFGSGTYNVGINGIAR